MTPSEINPCPKCGAESADEANISCRGAIDERDCGMTPSSHGLSAAAAGKSREVEPRND